MGPAASRGFWWGLLSVALVVVTLSFWVATREWFSRDDFLFLAHVQQADAWSWRRVFLPFDERFWIFYRPLSMETFFWVGHRLFGLEATGYFALMLAVHFATAGLVYRVARQLALCPQVAAATALLAVSRPGSLGEIYYGSVFMYVGQVAFSLVCITAFLDHLRRPRHRLQLLACAGLLLALGCNEAAAATPVLSAWAAVAAGELRRGALGPVLRALAPQAALVALYLVFRFVWIAPVEAPVLYELSLGRHVPINALRLLALVFGGPAGLALAVGSAACLFAAAGPRTADTGTRRFALRAGLGCAGWLASALTPFVLLPFPQGRWAMPLAVPAALLLGVAVEVAWRQWGRPRPRAFEATLVALLLATLPYATLSARAQDPVGEKPRRIVRFIEGQRPPLPERAVLVVLYGAPGLADAEQGERFRYLAYGGGLLNALDPETQKVLRFQDLARRPARNVLRGDAIYLALLPDLQLERAGPALLELELRRPAPEANAVRPRR